MSDSLMVIERTLIGLSADWDNCETDEERQACEIKLRAVLAAEVQKVDSICYVVKQFKTWQDEAERLAKRAKAYAAAIDRIKAGVKYTLEAARNEEAIRISAAEDISFEDALARLPLPKIQTATSTLRIQKNGGVESVEIEPGKEGNIADKFVRVTLEMALDEVKAWETAYETEGSPLPFRRISQEFSLSAIREAIKDGAAIDGVKLVRGTHLRVEGGPGSALVQW